MFIRKNLLVSTIGLLAISTLGYASVDVKQNAEPTACARAVGSQNEEDLSLKLEKLKRVNSSVALEKCIMNEPIEIQYKLFKQLKDPLLYDWIPKTGFEYALEQRPLAVFPLFVTKDSRRLTGNPIVRSFYEINSCSSKRFDSYCTVRNAHARAISKIFGEVFWRAYEKTLKKTNMKSEQEPQLPRDTVNLISSFFIQSYHQRSPFTLNSVVKELDYAFKSRHTGRFIRSLEGQPITGIPGLQEKSSQDLSLLSPDQAHAFALDVLDNRDVVFLHMLLAQGFDKDTVIDSKGARYSLIQWAVLKKLPKQFNLLMQAKATMDWSDALVEQAFRAEQDVFSENFAGSCVDVNRVVVNSRDGIKHPIVVWAVSCNKPEAYMRLLEQGADIASVDGHGSPLFLSALMHKNQSDTYCDMLISRLPLDSSAKDNEGSEHPLVWWIVYYNNLNELKKIAENGSLRAWHNDPKNSEQVDSIWKLAIADKESQEWRNVEFLKLLVKQCEPGEYATKRLNAMLKYAQENKCEKHARVLKDAGAQDESSCIVM